jgi:hypothetical protein
VALTPRPRPAAPVAATPPTEPRAPEAPLPSFTMAVHDGVGQVIMLVPASATDAEVTNLIHAIRSAGKRSDGDSIRRFFPPTTPRGSRGPYGIIQLWVMSDAQWATPARLKMYLSTDATAEYEREFANRVRAYYLHPIAGPEYGSIGFRVQGPHHPGMEYKTPNYKQLF